jgi:hypothetical protein
MLKFTLVTSVAAGNRLVHLGIYDGATTDDIATAPTVQAAGVTREYTWYPGNTNPVVDTTIACTFPPGLTLLPTWSFYTVTDTKDAADQFSLIALIVRRWLVNL